VAQKFHFAILRIEVTPASRGLSAIAELLVLFNYDFVLFYNFVYLLLNSVILFLLFTLVTLFSFLVKIENNRLPCFADFIHRSTVVKVIDK